MVSLVLAFFTGSFLMCMVFMMDNSSYLMNLTVQTAGQYFQYAIFQLSFHTDAFGQLLPGEGRAIDGNAAETWWFDAWTIFYVSHHNKWDLVEGPRACSMKIVPNLPSFPDRCF